MYDRSDWTRRSFLQAAGAGVFATLTSAADAAPIFADEVIIDCHAQISSEDKKTYPPAAKPFRPPSGKGTIDHLRHQALMFRGEGRPAGVKFATAIHSNTFYGWDNRFIADASRDNNDFIVGICSLDPDDPTSPKTLEEYVKSYNIRGMHSTAAKSGKLDDPGVEALWDTAERLEIPINVIASADKHAEIIALAKRHPKLRVVIDHCLNIKAGPTLEPTLNAMRDLAALPNVFAKLSFIPSGSSEPFPCRDMHEPCLAVIKAFGPERCVWGSRFPCELWSPKVTYREHLNIFTHALGLDEKVRRSILSETPRQLWFGGKAPQVQGVPEFAEEWNILIEGYGGTPVDRTWFRLALSADGTIHVAKSRRNSYRKLFQGKLTDDEIKRFYTAVAAILTGSSKSQGNSEDGWSWSLEISSRRSIAISRFAGHGELNKANPAFSDVVAITNGHITEGIRFPE